MVTLAQVNVPAKAPDKPTKGVAKP